jgi:hypothetical protein
MTTATLPYDLSVPELFHPEQIITQLIDGDDGRQHPISRVVHTVGERSITLSSPSAPSLGVEEWGTFDHAVSGLRPLTDLLPPNVGVIDKLGWPRTNRTLVNRLGVILTAQRIPGARVSCAAPLNGSLTEAWAFVGPRFARYTLDLINAYMPFACMNVALVEPATPFARDRVIIVKPMRTED